MNKITIMSLVMIAALGLFCKSTMVYAGEIVSENNLIENEETVYEEESDIIEIESGDIPVDAAHFPDEYFRQYIKEHSANKEPKNILTQDEINNLKQIYLENDGKTHSVKGIEYLTGLTGIDLGWINTTSFDVSKNILLEDLNCNHCGLTSLDVSKNKNLKHLSCDENKLTSLDISNNMLLERLSCGECGLTSLNVSKNLNLKSLNCRKNSLTSLNVRNNVALEKLDFTDNALQSIDLSKCTKLTKLDCYGNDLTELDTSNNTALKYLSCGYWVDYKGGKIKKLNTASNKELIYLDCTNNELVELNVDNNAKLRDLYCSNNQLKTINLNTNTDLEALKCENNQIEDINVSRNGKLKRLICDINKIKKLDLSGNPKLIALSCVLNKIKNLDLSNNPDLTTLYAYDNELVFLDIKNCNNLNTTVGSQNVHLQGKELDLSRYPGFNASRVSNLKGAEIKDNKLTVANKMAYYEYDMGSDRKLKVYLYTDSSDQTDVADLESIADSGVADFVERLYSVALGRASEAGGKAYWIQEIKNGASGADLARGFLYSQEFLNKNVSDTEFVKILYKTFFDRDPDQEGFDSWVKALAEGKDKKDVVDGFINSQEYSNLCLSYRIDAGTGVKPNIKVEPTQQVVDFAERLYSICLDRKSDEDGLKYWSEKLGNMEDSGTQVAYGFFFSPEFLNKNTTNADFVFRLYRTFFDREPDTAGFNNWMRTLSTGSSREEVFNGFTQSQEWKNLCAKNGIVAGKETFEGDTRVASDTSTRTWIKETVDTGRRRTAPVYERFHIEWCNACHKEYDCYDPNDGDPDSTHWFDTEKMDGLFESHSSWSGTIGHRQVGTFQDRILETHERCIETGEIRNRTIFWEEGERSQWRENIWVDTDQGRVRNK